MRAVKNPNTKECCRCLYRLGFDLREIEPLTNQSNRNIYRWTRSIDRVVKRGKHFRFEASVNFKIMNEWYGEIKAWNRIDLTWAGLSFCVECGCPFRKSNRNHRTCSERCAASYSVFVLGLNRVLSFTGRAEGFKLVLNAFRCAECGTSKPPQKFSRNNIYCSNRCQSKAFWKRAKAEGRAERLIAVKRNNPKAKLAKHLRRRLWELVKKGRAVKYTSAMNLIGCTVDHFRIHIESQFAKGMTWENYGSYWHVDHKRPCASFDLAKIDDQRKCFHWTNLQPLTREDNFKKGARLIAA